MPRTIKLAAAQMGPNNEGTPREAIVERMLGLLEHAIRDGVELIAYPEMALTTYFPKKVRPRAKVTSIMSANSCRPNIDQAPHSPNAAARLVHSTVFIPLSYSARPGAAGSKR